MTFGKPTPESVAADRLWRQGAARKYQETQQRKPLRQVSRKRDRINRTEYAPLRDAYLEAHPFCERCGKPRTCLHHKRGKVGPLLTDVRWFAASCTPCNDFAETHTGEALAEGWLLPQFGLILEDVAS